MKQIDIITCLEVIIYTTRLKMSIPYFGAKSGSGLADYTTPDPVHPPSLSPPEVGDVGGVCDIGQSPKDPVEEAMMKLTERYASNFAENEKYLYEAIAKTRLAGEKWCSSDSSWLTKPSIAEAKYVASRLRNLGYQTRIVERDRYNSWSVDVRNPDKVKSCCVQ